MNERLKSYLDKNFNAEETALKLIKWIKEWFDNNGPDSPVVIGISGGKDSSTVAALCVRALGKDRVFGVLMPDHEQSDIDVSLALVKHLGIKYSIVNVGQMTDAVKKGILNSDIYQNGEKISDSFGQTTQMGINVPPRIRMTTLYAISQTMNGRVSNNCNASENFVGYSTLFGDAAGDFSPLHNLTVTEVIMIGEYLGLPEMFTRKSPSDGLSGKTDEDNFGFTYEDLDTYIYTGTTMNEKIDEMILKRHKANEFKMKPMAAFRCDK